MKEKWVEKLPHVLWTYRTTPRRSIGETPFSMTYGAKVVIPLETGFPMLRTSSFNLSDNNGLLEKKLGFYWRNERKCNGPIGILPTQAQVRLWCQCEAETVSAWWLGVEKGSRYCKKPSMGKAGAELGGAISHHLNGWYRSIFPRRPRWTCNTTPLECKQLENVLLLIKVSFVICSFIV